VRSLRVRLAGNRLSVQADGESFVAVPSMQHPAFQEVLRSGWVSPPSFGPTGQLRLYSAARGGPTSRRYEWFASADWRRGHVQVDRRGAITDIVMEPYGPGSGRVRGEPLEVVIAYGGGPISITVGDGHSALGRWNAGGLEVEADEGAGRLVDEALCVALYLWCARPDPFIVRAEPPFA
jgi:hypothetical protein